MEDAVAVIAYHFEFGYHLAHIFFFFNLFTEKPLEKGKCGEIFFSQRKLVEL